MPSNVESSLMMKAPLPESLIADLAVRSGIPANIPLVSKWLCTEHWFPKFIKQAPMNIKEQMGTDTIIVGELTFHSTLINRQKINTDIL
jgi:hypothetical protein